MKIADIKNLNKKDVIPSIEGRVIQIYTKAPTPRQVAANIEPQDVIVEDDDGDQIRVQILRKGMHLPPGSQGRRVLFECGEGDRGPDGLTADHYNNETRACCSGSALIRFRDEEAAPAPLPEVKDKEPVKQNPAASRPRNLNITDHALSMVYLFNTIREKLNAPEMSHSADDIAARLATTVYIETARQALITPRVEGDPAPPPMVETPAPDLTDLTPAFPHKKEECAQTVQKTVSDMVSYQIRQAGTTPEIAEKFMKKHGYTWEQVYDEVIEQLVMTGIDKKYLDQAYDEFNGIRLARNPSETEEGLLKKLFFGVKDFADTARDMQNADTDIAL